MKRCARCGIRLTVNRPRVYSHFTRLHYCADISACEKRATRKPRKQVLA